MRQSLSVRIRQLSIILLFKQGHVSEERTKSSRPQISLSNIWMDSSTTSVRNQVDAAQCSPLPFSAASISTFKHFSLSLQVTTYSLYIATSPFFPLPYIYLNHYIFQFVTKIIIILPLFIFYDRAVVATRSVLNSELRQRDYKALTIPTPCPSTSVLLHCVYKCITLLHRKLLMTRVE